MPSRLAVGFAIRHTVGEACARYSTSDGMCTHPSTGSGCPGSTAQEYTTVCGHYHRRRDVMMGIWKLLASKRAPGGCVLRTRGLHPSPLPQANGTPCLCEMDGPGDRIASCLARFYSLRGTASTACASLSQSGGDAASAAMYQALDVHDRITVSIRAAVRTVVETLFCFGLFLIVKAL